MLAFSQYLLILFSVLTGGEYILAPTAMIWSGIGAGYLFAVSICFNENNGGWHIARKKIKKFKAKKKYELAVFKCAFVYALLAFASALAGFFSCAAIGLLDPRSAQTAAFVSYFTLCAATAPRYIKGKRLFDFGILKNKIYAFALALNLCGILCAVFLPAVRDFLGFGEIGAGVFGTSAAIGLFFSILTAFFKKNILAGE
jgi:hypothetical protein